MAFVVAPEVHMVEDSIAHEDTAPEDMEVVATVAGDVEAAAGASEVTSVASGVPVVAAAGASAEGSSGATAGAAAGETSEAAMWQQVEWLTQCSKHLHHIEGRMMENEYLGHEIMRQVSNHLVTFSPPPRGDWGWLLRKCLDIAVRALRQLVKYYMGGNEDKASFLQRAIALVRLYFEEAFHRCLLGGEDALMKAAYCSIVVSMRSFEIDTLGARAPELGVFWTFTEGNVRSMAQRVGRNEPTSLEICPSFTEVMRSPDMRVEAFSLLLVRVQPSSIMMSRAEVRHVIESLGGEVNEEEAPRLPGTASPSPFAQFFRD